MGSPLDQIGSVMADLAREVGERLFSSSPKSRVWIGWWPIYIAIGWWWFYSVSQNRSSGRMLHAIFPRSVYVARTCLNDVLAIVLIAVFVTIVGELRTLYA